MDTTMKRMLTAGTLGVAAWWGIKQLVRQGRKIDLSGCRALVTGGSRGLGLVIARQLVDHGARVAVCARTAADVEAAKQELEARGGAVLGIPCDVRDRDAVSRMVDHISRHWGGVDLLFNVAGTIEVGPLDAMTEDDFRDAMESNCWSALHTSLAVLPHMRRQGWGRIVNIASIGGKQAVPHLLPYVASKFALVGLSRGLRTELAKDGIYVTTACPSLMRTGSPRNATFKGQHREEYAWFSIGDSLPLVSMSAERAAAQVLDACRHGDGEVFISNLLNLPVLAQSLAPGLTQEVLGYVNLLLPRMGGIGQRAARGYDSTSWLSPSWLTRLSEEAAKENNQMRPHPLEG